jgi:hypothetical protein
VPGGVEGVKTDPDAQVDTAPRPDTGSAIDTAVEDTTVVDGYPAGPYDKVAGAVFPPLTLDGYRDGTTAWTKLSMKDYFDADGTKGIRGVVVIVAAQWCGVCQNEAKWVPTAYTTNYKAKGARFLTALVQDLNHKPANQAVADSWREYYAIPYAVAIDPTLATLPKGMGTLSLPYMFVIDPRTMRIEKVYSAAQPPPTIPALDTVLARNE